MRRKQLTPLIFILLLVSVAVGLVVVSHTTPELGLDLQGGVQVVLQPKGKANGDSLDQAVSIIRNRVDALGVAEPDIARQGDSIVVQLPGVQNQQRALDLVGDTAELRFRPVVQVLPGSIADLTKAQADAATSTTVAGDTTDSSVAGDDSSTTIASAPASTDPPVAGQSASGPASLYQDDGSTTVVTSPTTATTATPPSSDSTVAGTPDSTTTTVASGEPGDEEGYTPRDQDLPDQPVILPERDRKDETKIVATYQLGPSAASGTIVSGASAELQQNGQWAVRLEIKADGIDQFNAIAGQCNAKAADVCPSGQLAIVLDSQVVSAPTISRPSYERSQIQITGSFSQSEAKDLALVLNYGSLPVVLERVSVDTVSATLGKDSLHAGLAAGLLGLILVILYMLVYYRSLGLVVALGLVVWSGLNYSIICWLGQTQGLALSLSGVTGLVVSVGVTVDSYVVYFERLKDEVAAGRPLRSSTERAFKRSWRTILAANMSSLIGAVLLYLLTVGPVRGFAFFLGLATALDVVVAWFFIRPMVGLMSRNGFFAENRIAGITRGLMGKAGTMSDPDAAAAERRSSVFKRLYHGETSADFVGRFRTWILVSTVVIVVGALSFGFRGLNLGIDFEGGAVWEVPAHDLTVQEAREAVEGAGLKNVTVQTLAGSGEKRLKVEAESVDIVKEAEIRQLLAEKTGASADEVDVQAVGPSWGQEISAKALRALIAFLIAITIYISFRFELRMAIPTLVALLHDIVITVGVYSIFGFEVTPATVIAILTILGFSIYDGIVVFDKVEENTNLVGTRDDLTYGEMVDKSLNQVLMRSLNTSITALLPVASLLVLGSFILGATTLEEFALALLIGLFAGAYSSIFIASPMLAWLKERDPRYRDIKERVWAKRGGSHAMRHTTGRGGVTVPTKAKGKDALPTTSGAPSGGGTATAVLDARPVQDDVSPGQDAAPPSGAASGDRVIPPRPRKKGKKR